MPCYSFVCSRHDKTLPLEREMQGSRSNVFISYRKNCITVNMNRIFRYAFWKLKGVKVYALVGRSGTGKSFRSKLVAEKHNIDLIIDDGLLIRDERIIAG